MSVDALLIFAVFANAISKCCNKRKLIYFTLISLFHIMLKLNFKVDRVLIQNIARDLYSSVVQRD